MKPELSQKDKTSLVERTLEERNYKSEHLSQAVKEDIAKALFQSYQDVQDILNICPVDFDIEGEVAYNIFVRIFDDKLFLILILSNPSLTK